MLKNRHKYHEHFKEFPEKMRPTLQFYFRDDEIKSPCDYNKLKARLTHENLLIPKKNYPEHSIRYEHRDFLQKYVSTYLINAIS